MNAIVTIGVDLAKNVFAAHGVVTEVKPVLLCAGVPCTKLRELIAALSTCLVDVETRFGERQLRGG